MAQRTREVGVRMALGAAASRIERMVLREGFRPVVEGLAIGLFIGIVARAGLRALVVATVPIVDVFTLATVPIPLGLAAFLACYLRPAAPHASIRTVALRHL